MPTSAVHFRSIDQYIQTCPEAVQLILQHVRAVIHQTAPAATETIKYQMPAFRLGDADLIYFAAFKAHIGMYPPIAASAPFKAKLARYEGPKGALRFPLAEPMPLLLIAQIVKFRMRECNAKI